MTDLRQLGVRPLSQGDAQGDEIVLGRAVLSRLHVVLDGLAAVTEIIEDRTV